MPDQKPVVYGGRYEVERLLGSGSMGDVFVARHKLTDQRVALKVLFPNVARNVGGVERFLMEVRTASSIEHAGVIRIFDAGEDNGTFYYAMELLEGQTLDDWLRSQTRPLAQALGLVHKMLGALAAAHDKGIVHRDIKPENIFVTHLPGEQPNVKLLDFGIARDLQATRMTQTGHTLGTPTYMSPEQATEPHNLTPASDVWSVGVMLYEIITGRVPFDADTPQAICIRAICNPHPPIHSLVPGICPELEAVVDRCLLKAPQERPANARQLKNAMGQALATLIPVSSHMMTRQMPLVTAEHHTAAPSPTSMADALRASASQSVLVNPAPVAPEPPANTNPHAPITAQFSPMPGPNSGPMPQMPAQRGLLSPKRPLALLFITLMASLAVATTWAMRPMVEQQAQPELHALGAQAQHLTHQTRAAWPKPVAPPAAVAAPDAADSASAAEPDKAAEAEVHMDFTSAPPPSPKRRKPHSNTAKDAGVANNKTAKNTKNTKTQNPKARRDEPKAPAHPTPQPPDAPIALDNASKDDGEQPQTEDKVSDAKPPIAPKKADNDAQHPAQPSKESPQPSENRPLKRDEGQKEDSSDQPFMTF